MKIKNIYSMLLLSGGLMLSLASCEDEVLVETKDETKANELLTAIAAADAQLATLNVESNSLIISNAEAEKLIQQYEDLRDELMDPYSEPTEVTYTVTVLSSSNAAVSSARSKGYEGATIVVEQNGLVLEPSSSSNGLYLFTGLKQGYVYVRVGAPDHTSVEYRAYIYLNNGNDVASAQSFNAQTQVVLYAISGDVAAKYEGKAYANTSILNDTLNRKYGSDAVFGEKANTYIASPAYNFYDYTYYWDGTSPYNFYNVYMAGSNYVVNHENALAGHKIYAYPEVQEYANNDWQTENGVIYEIIYKGLVTSTTIAADGSFTLPVVSTASYDDNSLVNEIRIFTEEYVAPHTRFTSHAGTYFGQLDEAGSVETDIKYYNNTNSAVTPFSGTGVATVSIDPATAATLKRRVITEDWIYYPASSSTYIYDIPLAGETRNLNIYFQPRERE